MANQRLVEWKEAKSQAITYTRFLPLRPAILWLQGPTLDPELPATKQGTQVIGG